MLNNPMMMLQKFNEFRSTFKGDPKQEVERLVAQGKISQQQLNQLQNMASQFQQMMSSFNK